MSLKSKNDKHKSLTSRDDLDLEKGKIQLRDVLPIEKGFVGYSIKKHANTNKLTSKIHKPLVPNMKSKSKKHRHKGITYFEFIPYDANYPSPIVSSSPLSSITSTTNDNFYDPNKKYYKKIKKSKSNSRTNTFSQFVDIENSTLSRNTSRSRGIRRSKKKSKKIKRPNKK